MAFFGGKILYDYTISNVNEFKLLKTLLLKLETVEM